MQTLHITDAIDAILEPIRHDLARIYFRDRYTNQPLLLSQLDSVSVHSRFGPMVHPFGDNYIVRRQEEYRVELQSSHIQDDFFL